MEHNKKFIIKEFLRFILYSLITIALLLLMFGITHIDIASQGGIPELSLTEFLQEILLLSSACIFSFLACKHQRQGLWLVSGFLFCMFIRELDILFDMIFHGAWKYIALSAAVFFVFLALKNGLDPVVEDLTHFMQKKNYRFLFFSLMLILIVSRILGSMELVRLIAPFEDTHQYFIKNFMEESVELLGYFILFIASCCYYREYRKESKEIQ